MNQMFAIPRCGIFAGMGMGKTTSALTVIDGEFLSGTENKPALILAPLRVAQNTWPDEAAKWSHLSGIEVKPITGSIKERKKAMQDTNANVFTINYENLPWFLEELNGKWPYGRVIADESTKLKSFRLRQGGQRAQAIARVAHRKIERWTNLTGTPAPNGLIDLWGQTWFLDAGHRLGRSFSDFRNRWFIANRVGRDPHAVKYSPAEYAQEQIETKLKDICWSLNAADYFSIEQPIKYIVNVKLPAKARRLYSEMERQFFICIQDFEVEAFSAAARSQKLLQLASGAVYVDPMVDSDEQARSDRWTEVHDEKMQALETIIGEANGMPVLVAYHFNSTRERLIRHFKNCRLLDKSPQTLRDWNNGKIPLLAAHPASAGHGLNMQDGGNIIVHIDHDWNLENFDQINERIGPMRQLQAGYNRNVFQYYIVAEDTMDEVVMARRETKSSIQSLFMQALKRKGVT